MQSKWGGAFRNDYRGHNLDWDTQTINSAHIMAFQRVSKNQIIFGANYFPTLLKSSPCWIVWDKRKDEKYSNDFADCEIAWTSFDKPAKMFRYLWSGMLQENMRQKEERFHPTQKPIALMEWIIKNFSKQGDVICDPFMGSGSTGIAALKLQRRFIGVEIDEKYFEIAKKRIGGWENQSRLPFQ